MLEFTYGATIDAAVYNTRLIDVLPSMFHAPASGCGGCSGLAVHS